MLQDLDGFSKVSWKVKFDRRDDPGFMRKYVVSFLQKMFS